LDLLQKKYSKECARYLISSLFADSPRFGANFGDPPVFGVNGESASASALLSGFIIHRNKNNVLAAFIAAETHHRKILGLSLEVLGHCPFTFLNDLCLP
jgi:hypothetical protein